ncbi:hypothetical protein [Aquisphaera insulae]|uniref:hypothetical protein n=1 Tax=Aquisphaera insulae TaxID=2712864 RepID=UPI0013EB8D7B|nr:hypothetical protein [Aquisphaera insulae]
MECPRAGSDLGPRSRRDFLARSGLLALAPRLSERAAAAPPTPDSPPRTPGFRGVFFNPNVRHAAMEGYPFPVFDPYDPPYREGLRAALRDLAREAAINLVCLFVPIQFTLARAGVGPRPGQPVEGWANLTYLKNLAVFVDDCHEAGVSVELDLVDNRWIPGRLDGANHIGKPGSGWPVADDSHCESAATWYAGLIRFVEERARHPEQIALWSMMGNHQLGCAEPVLWGIDPGDEILRATERFVKKVWPAFRSAGKRPKAAPYLLPIFSNNAYWMAKTPEQRLSGFSHLKTWLVDDLALPPDYWPMSSYAFCDPAPDGYHYLRRIVEILGRENAPRILLTDLKGPGHEHEIKDSILATAWQPGNASLRWHRLKCAEYGLAGWWIWAYQDHPGAAQRAGIRGADGAWKAELVHALREPLAR